MVLPCVGAVKGGWLGMFAAVVTGHHGSMRRPVPWGPEQAGRLKSLRSQLGLVQEQVARRMRDAGASASQKEVSEWERGQGRPSAAKLAALCQALDCEEADLIGATGGTSSRATARAPISDGDAEAMLRDSLDRVTQALLLFAQADLNRSTQPADMMSAVHRIIAEIRRPEGAAGATGPPGRDASLPTPSAGGGSSQAKDGRADAGIREAQGGGQGWTDRVGAGDDGPARRAGVRRGEADG